MAETYSAFPLPLNALKKETSLYNKWTLYSHESVNNLFNWDIPLDKGVHTQGVKIKLFIAGWNLLSATDKVYYIGKWVELECHEMVYEIDRYTLTFTCRYQENINKTIATLQLRSQTDPTIPCVMYIEKISVMDSDFNAEDTWLGVSSPILTKFDPPIPPEKPAPPEPVGVDPDPNNTWIY